MKTFTRIVVPVLAHCFFVQSMFAQSVKLDPGVSTPVATTLVNQKGQEPVTLPQGVSKDWYEQSMDQLRKREYYIQPFGENGNYAAANVRQRLGFLFTPEGYKVKNMQSDASTEAQWEAAFQFKGIRRSGRKEEVSWLKSSLHQDDFLEYRFQDYTVQYLNNEQGMRQNFVVWKPVAGKGKVELVVDLSGDLTPKLVAENKLVLHDRNNEKNVRMIYDGIKVWDANDKLLEATLSLNSDHEIIIAVNDDHAAYPITIDPLNHAPDWTDSGDGLLFSALSDLSTPVLYGTSVSGAGDLNNDGFDDVIIGAPAYVEILNLGSGTFNAVSVGAAFVYYGSATGLSVNPNEVLQPTSIVGALFGFSVSGAGDVNGDGRADVVVGAPGDKTNLTIGLNTVSVSVGKVYVYYGTQFDGNANTQPTVSATLTLKQADFTALITTPVNPLYGFSVSSAGDVNNDGKADIIVGAPAFIDLLSLNLAGRVDIYHGSASGISATPTKSIKGGLLNGLFGYSVSTAGKVNNDAYSDVIVGAPASISLLGVGSAFVFHGSSTGITANAATDANSTLSSPGLLSKTLFGYSVSNAGDVNGDGRGDVIVGEPLALDLFSGSTVAVGKAHIYYGSNSGIQTTNRTQLTSPRKPGILGAIAGNLLFGFSVSGIQDMNCDGVDDVIVGEPGGTGISLGTGLLGLVSANVASGQAYIFYGKNTTGPVDNPGYTISQEGTVSVANLLGYSVKGTGDVNNDDKPDFLIGAPNGTLNLGSSLTSIIGNTLGYLTTSSIGSVYEYNGCTNLAPVAANDNISTNEDTPVTFNIISNDADPDGSLNLASIDLNTSTPGIQNSATTSEGTWTVNPTGDVTFTPVLNYNGPASLSYRVNDNVGANSNAAIMTVTVIPVNDLPVAVNDNAVTPEDVPVTITVVSNDTDIDGTIDPATVDLDPSTAGIQSTITNASGVWSVNASGVVTFTPALNANGPKSTTYTVNDNSGGTSNIATINVSVTAVNDAPVAVNDNTTGTEDSPLSFNIVSNDTDVDGTINAASVDLDPSTVGKQSTLVTPAGTWTVNAAGLVTFTPVLNFNGTASITYTVDDNLGLTSNVATISVSVAADNDAPIAVNDNPSTDEDVPLTVNVTANDTDVDGTIMPGTVDLDPLTPGVQTSVTTPAGTWVVNASGNVTYTPTANFNGTATVTYTVKDNDGATSNVATIAVTVSSVNDAPLAVNDNASGNEDGPIVIPVTANDTDVDGSINPATVDLNPAVAGIQSTVTNPGGTWTADASGNVTLTPTANFNGSTSVSYTVNDNSGTTSNTATITVTVNGVNDAPVAVNDNATTNEDNAVSFSLVANDTDVDGSIDAATVDLDPGTGGIQNSISTSAGSWLVNGSGQITFTPVTNFNGSAAVTYTVNDNGGLTSNIATATVTVNAVNDAPIAVADGPSTGQNLAVTFNVTANDSDPDGTINTATVDLNTSVGGIQNTATTPQGTWSVTATGNVTFTPALNFTGTASILYTVNDDGGATSNTAAITVNVLLVPPANVAPVAVNDNASTNQAVAVTFSVTSNDTDSDGTIDAATVDLNLVSGGIQNTFSNVDGTWIVNATGYVTFTPSASFHGPISITYRVQDNSGTPSNTATISVAVNAAPVANDDAALINEDSPATISVTLNDTDADGTINTGSVDLDPSTAGIQNTFTASGVWSVNASGVVTFTPALNASGAASITYTVKDNSGATSNAATINVTITAVNDAPVAVNDNATTPEDAPISFNVVSNDTDVDGTINAGSVDLDPTLPGKQTTLTPPSGTWTVNGAGQVTFTPALDFNGAASITYTVDDNGGLTSNVATISVNVTSVNDAPIAVNDNPTTDEDLPVTFNVVGNDTDVDGSIVASTVDLDPVAVGVQASFTTPAGTWTVNAAGSVTYTPTLNFNGTATTTYTVKDNDGAVSNSATITVTVSSVNDSPIAVNDVASGNEDTPIVVTVTTNDSDPDGTINPATVDLNQLLPGVQSSVATPAGTWSVDINGVVTLTPADDFSGPGSVTYTVNDNGGATSNAATITVTVNAVNDAPVAVNDNSTTLEDTAVTLTVVTNDTDADGTIDAATVDLDPTSVGIQNTITVISGVWTANATGQVTFTPAANLNGTASITYTVNDNSGLTSNQATISVAVAPVNDPPVAVDDHIFVNEDVTLVFSITSNDTDVDGTINSATVDLDPTSASIESTFTTANGVWSVSALGNITYVPVHNLFGPTSIGYTVKDNDGAISNVGIISVDLISVNDPPVAVDDTDSTYVGSPITFNIFINDWDTDSNIDITSGCLTTPNGAVNRFFWDVPQGHWTLSTTGDVTFTPEPGFVGIVMIPYTVQDEHGEMSNEARVAVTVLPLPAAVAGLAKEVSAPVLQPDGSSKMTFTFTLENLGAKTINDIQVTDDMVAAFPAPATYTIVEGSATGGLVYNSTFDGSINTRLLTSASKLEVGETQKIVLTLTVNPNGKPGAFSNSATVISKSDDGTEIFTDISDQGNDPDANDNNDPTDPGENDATIINVIQNPVLKLTKRMVDTPVKNGDCTYTVTFGIEVANTGNVDFTNLKLTDDLALAIVSPSTYNVTSIMSDVLTVNNGYNGSSDKNLLAAGNTLWHGQTVEIRYSVIISPNEFYGPFLNTVNAQASDDQGMIFQTVSEPVTFAIIPQEMFVPEGFSPNGDGLHDTFEITLSCGLETSLTIFNRWGEKVYHSDRYANDWGGAANHGAFMNKLLPEGTYFYTCHLTSGAKITSFLTIKH